MSTYTYSPSPLIESELWGEDHSAELSALLPPQANTAQHEFTEKEAAAFLGLSLKALASRRRAGKGPECYSISKKRAAIWAGADDLNEAARWTGGKVTPGDLRYSREALLRYV